MITTESQENKYAQTLDRIDDLMADFVEDGAVHTTSINGVTFQFATLDELLKLRAHFKALAEIEDRKNGLQRPAYRIKQRLYL